ncbi:hypothetical protein IV203_028371 [Nitzschia inconspicua]|uniref:Uncharacterized protein n=1 Tax=Nitzschia inconspicua TaxID=303405 RepID=A0A9K3LSF4_9STRA|nr:hypothetical protein IV203_011255 [Nitzschia inconspicua]KAG7365701.1 hypothetical protein IV203_028371 [Nitzschia inconspicua]
MTSESTSTVPNPSASRLYYSELQKIHHDSLNWQCNLFFDDEIGEQTGKPTMKHDLRLNRSPPQRKQLFDFAYLDGNDNASNHNICILLVEKEACLYINDSVKTKSFSGFHVSLSLKIDFGTAPYNNGYIPALICNFHTT